MRDITARKLAEEGKQKLDAQLQQIRKMEAISTLAEGIANRFNNTLSLIAGNIELIKLEFPENEIIDEYTRPIGSSIRHLAQLTAQLLAYAREGGHPVFEMTCYDIINVRLRKGSSIEGWTHRRIFRFR